MATSVCPCLIRRKRQKDNFLKFCEDYSLALMALQSALSFFLLPEILSQRMNLRTSAWNADAHLLNIDVWSSERLTCFKWLTRCLDCVNWFVMGMSICVDQYYMIAGMLDDYFLSSENSHSPGSFSVRHCYHHLMGGFHLYKIIYTISILWALATSHGENFFHWREDFIIPNCQTIIICIFWISITSFFGNAL